MQRERLIKQAMKNEITEYEIYKRLSKDIGGENGEILRKIAEQELSHYKFWSNLLGEEVKPSKFKLYFYLLVSKLLGLNFGIRLMELGEERARISYAELEDFHPAVKGILEEERNHEETLLALLDKRELEYSGSFVLGLSDAIVELLGALAGFTLALRNTKLVVGLGLITGIAAALSMASSEYLSTKEEGIRNPIKASVYTGLAYIMSVVALIMPFFLISSPFMSLIASIAISIFIIAGFSFYIAVAKGVEFWSRAVEMSAIALSVAGISFLIGFLVRIYLGVDI